MLITLIILINSFIIYVFYKLIQNSLDKQAKIYIIITGIFAVSSISNTIIKSDVFHNIIILLVFINFIVYILKNNLKNRKIRKGLISLLQVSDYVTKAGFKYKITEIDKTYVYLTHNNFKFLTNDKDLMLKFRIKKSKIKYSSITNELYFTIQAMI